LYRKIGTRPQGFEEFPLGILFVIPGCFFIYRHGHPGYRDLVLVKPMEMELKKTGSLVLIPDIDLFVGIAFLRLEEKIILDGLDYRRVQAVPENGDTIRHLRITNNGFGISPLVLFPVEFSPIQFGNYLKTHTPAGPCHGDGEFGLMFFAAACASKIHKGTVHDFTKVFGPDIQIDLPGVFYGKGIIAKTGNFSFQDKLL
jgi:hypothetical protein